MFWTQKAKENPENSFPKGIHTEQIQAFPILFFSFPSLWANDFDLPNHKTTLFEPKSTAQPNAEARNRAMV